MKPTKKVAAKRPAKRKPAKRAVRRGSIEHKVMNLKNRINDTYHNASKRVNPDDMRWVSQLLLDVRENNWIKLSKEDMLKCNGLWRAYA